MALVAWAIADLARHPPTYGWFAITVVTAIIGAYNVKIPGLVVRLSLSEPTVFLATLLFGPAAGTLTAAVDALAMSLRLVPRLRTPHRILFNVGTLAASVLPASLLFFSLARINGSLPAYGAVETFVGPLYVFAIAVFAINSGLVATALGIERSSSPFRIWFKQFPWLAANYLASASIAAILVVFSQALDFALAALLLPLVVVSFFAYRTTLGRLDDANEHLTQVNQLYLSTIETLAMAIDAKDQVTHGHIRRVQRYAVALARAVGVSEDTQIKAIEAAALLHDMGKLAIPEFILNKPGKLTTREFSVMKTHAALGADLLSSIHFPYPVVPIVRHHHENWDGTGYPDGLRGAEIPIGARILAVVDCYDALTSHRPYRPAMTSDYALDVLSQRRGKMYDPLVVDAFIVAHDGLCDGPETEAASSTLLSNPPEHGLGNAAADPSPQAPASVESLRLLATLSPFPGGPLPTAVSRDIVQSLRGIASFDCAVVFCPSESVTELQVIYADGLAVAIKGAATPTFGERLSGWVAANRTAVWNADAALDFPGTADAASLMVGSALPLCTADCLVGVLTLYGKAGEEITMSERRAVEWLLPSISASLESALQRPGIVVDCTTPEVLSAALAALDALLSHTGRSPDRQPAAVIAATVVAGSSVNPGGQHVVDIAIANSLSPRDRQDRCLLVLGQGHYLYCALDDSDCETLAQEIRQTDNRHGRHALAINVSKITNSLDLQDVVRRMLTTVASVNAESVRVH